MPQRASTLPTTRLRPVSRLAPPPRHLDEEEAALFRQIVGDFQIDDAGSISLLTIACEAHQRMRRARERVEDEGETFLDRFKQVRAHPLLAVERDARCDYLRALRTLNLKPAPTVR